MFRIFSIIDWEIFYSKYTYINNVKIVSVNEPSYPKYACKHIIMNYLIYWAKKVLLLNEFLNNTTATIWVNKHKITKTYWALLDEPSKHIWPIDLSIIDVVIVSALVFWVVVVVAWFFLKLKQTKKGSFSELNFLLNKNIEQLQVVVVVVLVVV